MSKKKYKIRFSMSDCSEYFRSEIHMIAKLISHYQCLCSNKILYEARKVRFQNHKNDWKNQMNQRNLRILENKYKYYSWNHRKMTKNLDFEIVERIVILIIIFVLASGVIIPNAIFQKRMHSWIQNFQVFIVTVFLILLADPMSVLMGITYYYNECRDFTNARVQVQRFDHYFFDFINFFLK
jgi:hypothetical protein